MVTKRRIELLRNQLSRQFYTIIFLFIIIALSLLALDQLQNRLLDSVRAYVNGEAMWSKGQKDAIYHLARYVTSHEEKALEGFRDGISVSLGDRQARQSLQSNPPNINLAREGFIQGRNHVDDIDNMIWLFLYFDSYPDMKKAIEIWTLGDKRIDDLLALEQKIESMVKSGKANNFQIHEFLEQVDKVNMQVTELENEFSLTLGNAARQIKYLTNLSLFFFTFLLIIFGILISRKILKGIKESQIALIESEARFRYVVESNLFGIMFWDLNGTITDANDAFLNIIGYTHKDLEEGKINWQKLTPPESLSVDKKAIEEIYQRGYCSPYEKEYIHKHGHHVPIYLAAASFQSTREKGVCFVLDISKEKRAEQAQKLASTVFHSTSEAIMVMNNNAAIQLVNPAFTEITGYGLNDVLNRNPRILASDEIDNAFFALLWNHLKLNGNWKGEISNKRKNGELYKVLISITAIYGDDKDIKQYVAVFSDITEQQRLEEQLRQAQKMEAIGTLVGGIAHDFNNTLAAIQGNLFLARNYNNNNSVLAKLDIIEQLSKHSAGIIQQLLTFARKGSVKMTPLDLNPLFSNLGQMTKSFIRESINFNIHVGEKPLTVLGDTAQLQQVMLNLYNNSCDAIENAKNPQIETWVEEISADNSFMLKHPYFIDNRIAHISVSDNGCGISKVDQSHIFEPFFTTKEVGKGTGLGLSMVYGAIQTHRGAIEVESQKGKGTTVHIYLPLIDVTASEPFNMEMEDILDTNSVNVLLVDDNIFVRDTYKEALTLMGYNVTTANNGIDALNQFENKGRNFNIIVSDIVMPEMSGIQMMKQIRILNPDIPAIFITGYDSDVNAPENLSNSYVLKKPFSIHDLVQQVRDHLKITT